MDTGSLDPRAPDGESLTPSQQAAVEHVDGPMLMLAGPGSGKTRVVTHRIAHLLSLGISARRILALTFTNKAAEEMNSRLTRLAPDQPVWIGTFHRFGARLLRQHAPLVGLQENFSICDVDDSRRLLLQAVDEAGIELSLTTPDAILTAISRAKNQLVAPDAYVASRGHAVGGLVESVYPAYQKRLLANNCVDFDDLLMHVATILRDHPELRQALDDRYRYILVDEYQDTNRAQYAIARALSVDHPNLAVTGDPDQSIYGWRGANLSNILDFEHDYPAVKVVRLEENYRSTPNILRVADQLIAHNTRRKQKVLRPTRDEGAPVRLTVFPTGRDEADAIAARIDEEVASGRRRYSDYAILYRLNALSRGLETALRARRVPFQIIQGVEFYQRREIKDVLAYLQMLDNPANDVALTRIINVPVRKIGRRTIESLAAFARDEGLTLLNAARRAGLIPSLSRQAALAVARFVSLHDRLSLHVHGSLHDLLSAVLAESGYRAALESSPDAEDQERLANIEELLTAAVEFDLRHPDGGGLEEFLEQTALVSDTDELESAADRVTLMTLHAAKGLEFPVVFIPAVEEKMLPYERQDDDSSRIEEERRLLFVGITRAEEELQLSMAQNRDFRGVRRYNAPSCFLLELPRDELQYSEPESFHAERGRGDEDAWNHDSPGDGDFGDVPLADDESRTGVDGVTDFGATTTTRRFPTSAFRIGMVVDHPVYGSGKIVSLDGVGKKRVCRVDFFSDGIERAFTLVLSPLAPSQFE